MRLAFLGTPDFAARILDALLAAGHDIVAVYSQPPRPAGRGQLPRPSPVQTLAERSEVAVHTPRSLRNDEEQQRFAALDLDAAVVAAYGLILPKPILDAPRRGCLNVHASLLPRWRGAAPIQRAILAGDRETGVTIMQMDAGLDTGPMLLKERVPIGPDSTAGALQDQLAETGARLIVDALSRLDALTPENQPESGVTYAAKLGRDEGRLDWRRDAVFLERSVRAFDPWPGAWFELEGERMKVLRAAAEPGTATEPGTVLDARLAIACAEGVFRPLRIQRAGRAPMDVDAFLRGRPVPAGTVLPCRATDC
jgi:methionyl-tRNA formyltransferase